MKNTSRHCFLGWGISVRLYTHYNIDSISSAAQAVLGRRLRLLVVRLSTSSHCLLELALFNDIQCLLLYFIFFGS